MEKDFDIDKLDKLYKEGNQINPFFMDALYTIALNKLRKRQLLKKGEQYDEEEDQEEKTINIEDDFINFINKIDNYIGTFSYDELMIKPDFFLEMADANITNYINKTTKLLHFSNNDAAQINLDTSILDKKRLSSLSVDDFGQKKMFYDIGTEFISREKIYTDDNQELIFKFQYLVNTFFNTFIDMYKQKKGIDSKDIYFIFKGGTFMKILFEKYKNILKDNGDFLNKNQDFFKRSDSDYGIYINATFDKKTYTEHYYNLNILTYNILTKISKFINENLNEILPINQINDNDMEKLLEKYNTFLIANKGKGSNGDLKLPYFRDIDKFIGISIYDKTYMKKGEVFPNSFDLYTLKSTSKSTDEHGVLKIKGQVVDKSKFMKEHKKVPVKRNPFYITIKEQDGKYYQANEDIEEEPYDSGLYQYYNESNRFGTDANLTYFTLHRVKINIVLYFKTYNSRYGFFQCPSELIDVPIATIDDYKTQIDFSTYLKPYSNTINGKVLNFNSYTIYGLIDDMFKSLFIELEFPWLDMKYAKRVNRLTYFLMIYFNNNYSNVDEIKNKLLTFLNDYNNTNALIINFTTHNGTNSNNDKLYTEIIGYMKQINDRATAPNDKAKILEMSNLIIATIKLFKYEDVKSGYTDNPENVPYLKKYLKYKNKYLVLKNHNM